MKSYTYKTNGTCAIEVAFDIADNRTVHNVKFTRGCAGNAQGVAALVEGMEVDTVIERLKDIDCNGRGTSCPAQLANALSETMIEAAEKAEEEQVEE